MDYMDDEGDSIMVQMVIRAAQTAFNEAGYQREESYSASRWIAMYLLSNYDECSLSYGADDEFELAYRMAREVVLRLNEEEYLM